MKLFIYILNRTEKLEEILAGFVEIGLTGATLIDTVGMGEVLTRDVPVFAGFRKLLSESRPANKTIFAVVEDEAKIDAAIRVIEDICGPFGSAGAGIAFTLPLDRAFGLKPELE
jgi:nitrogen regulatory protein PII